MANQREQGLRMEECAARYLNQRGLVEVARNQHSRQGEIDLIMRDGNCLVFVEVRYRRHQRYGSALESITTSKRRRIVAAARSWLSRQTSEADCRFDVVALEGNPDDPIIDWIQHAFDDDLAGI